MARTNVDSHDDACPAVTDRDHLSTKRDAVKFALRTVADESLDLDAARTLRGSGWDGDLDELRSTRAP
jgi:Arc/MetJ family transcription regulator